MKFPFILYLKGMLFKFYIRHIFFFQNYLKPQKITNAAAKHTLFLIQLSIIIFHKTFWFRLSLFLQKKKKIIFIRRILTY
jgi:hypothetical protein